LHVISTHFCNKTLVVVNERVLRMSASSHVPLHIAVFHSVNVKLRPFDSDKTQMLVRKT